MKSTQYNEFKTLQEACDYSVMKLVKQGRRCVNENGKCVYGDGNGNYCGIGHLLDKSNKKLMNSDLAVGNLPHKYLPDLIVKFEYEFDHLQKFHDCSGNKKANALVSLSKHIDTSKPQYQKWLEINC